MIDFRNFHAVENLPQFYNAKKYVILSSENPDYKLKNISKLLIVNNKIYASDSYDRKIVVYDLSGNALSNIGNRGRGPGEFMNVTDFDVDNEGNLHLIDGRMDKLLIYDKSYKYTTTIDSPFEIDIIKCLSDGNYLFGLSSWNKSQYKDYRIMYVDKNMQVMNRAGKYDKKDTDDNVWFSDYFFIEMNDGIFYHKPVDDNIYLLDDKGQITKTYYFNFGANSIPVKKRGNLEPLINSDEIMKYQALMTFPVIQNNYAFGILYNKGKIQSFISDISNSTLFTEDVDNALMLGRIVSVNSNSLITYFPLVERDNLPHDFPVEMQNRLNAMDHLICIYEFNSNAQ